MSKLNTIFLIVFYFFLTFSNASTVQENKKSIFVIGQDVQSIKDFQLSLTNQSGIKLTQYPDGFMTYVAINDLRGLSEPVNQGAGVNYADELIQTYPKFKVVQIGLYMRYMLKEVVDGGLDRNIVQLGQWIKNSKKDVYLRIGYEFDNPENGYDPQDYIQAYRHIVDQFRKMNITNVYFVWHTMAWKDKDGPVYAPLKWYPGDKYVDWVGISFFDSQRDEEREAAAKLARKLNKPLMIAESSPFNQYTDQGKLQWIKKLFDYIKSNNVEFLSYINVNWDELPLFQAQKWGDARLQKSPVLFEEWLRQVEQFYKK